MQLILVSIGFILILLTYLYYPSLNKNKSQNEQYVQKDSEQISNEAQTTFENVEYDEQFDMFLYQEVSYSLLGNLTANVFCSPYGATSLREYFANCFEHYFYESTPRSVNAISPRAYEKIQELIERDEN